MPHYGCGRCELCTSGDYMHCLDQRDVLAETGQQYGTATYAEYVLKPDWLLVRIPDDVSLVHGAMACCGLGPSFGAAERMGLDALDTFVVSGCGPVGLGGLVHGAVRGARTIAVETQPYRADLARRLGAERVLDPTTEDVAETVRALTDGRGADAGLETSGAPGAAHALALALRRRGRMAVVAWTDDIVLPAPVPSGLEVFGVWHWNSLSSAERMWTTVRKARPLLDVLITHVLPLEEVSAAMDLQDAGACGKILLLPHGEFDDPVAA
jgi:threonine dehydrogenase-like Zn-dependent dehydrogenase